MKQELFSIFTQEDNNLKEKFIALNDLAQVGIETPWFGLFGIARLTEHTLRFFSKEVNFSDNVIMFFQSLPGYDAVQHVANSIDIDGFYSMKQNGPSPIEYNFILHQGDVEILECYIYNGNHPLSLETFLLCPDKARVVCLRYVKEIPTHVKNKKNGIY